MYFNIFVQTRTHIYIDIPIIKKLESGGLWERLKGEFLGGAGGRKGEKWYLSNFNKTYFKKHGNHISGSHGI